MSNKEEIPWGKKMIKVSIHFWTDNLPSNVDEKTAWAKGTIHLTANKFRNLKHDHVIFNNKKSLIGKLNELLEKNNIKLAEPSERISIVKLK